MKAKYYKLAGKVPVTPKQSKVLREEDVSKFRCFCTKSATRKDELAIIACDKCNATYHAVCVQGGAAAAVNMSVFICPRCEGKTCVPPIFELTPQQKLLVRIESSVLRQASQSNAEGKLFNNIL